MLPKRARIFLVVRGPAPSCRVAGVIPVQGHQGANTVYFAGRVHGRRLEPGVYLISLSRNRHDAPSAATVYVRVVSPHHSLPLPDRAVKPSCTRVASLAAAATLAGDVPPHKADAQPTAEVAAVAVQSPSGDENDEGASGLPDPGVLGAVAGDAAEHPFVAIALLTLVAGLLVAMLGLVTRFLRGSWNP